MKPFYELKVKDDSAELYIYGDIASDGYKWSDSDVSANDVVNQLQSITAKKIDVYINSYGGEVAQGLAIYNALKRSGAKITTVCDGFACSIASVIFMAGDVRKVYENSLLMIHNAWTYAQGNAEQLEKQAEDLRVINNAVKTAYMSAINITEDELTTLLDAESWITPATAIEMGFATEVVESKAATKASASAASAIFAALTKAAEEDPAEDPAEDLDEGDDIEVILTDIVARLEKLEAEIFPAEDSAENNEDDPEEDPAPENNKTADDTAMEKFLNLFKK